MFYTVVQGYASKYFSYHLVIKTLAIKNNWNILSTNITFIMNLISRIWALAWCSVPLWLDVNQYNYLNISQVTWRPTLCKICTCYKLSNDHSFICKLLDTPEKPMWYVASRITHCSANIGEILTHTSARACISFYQHLHHTSRSVMSNPHWVIVLQMGPFLQNYRSNKMCNRNSLMFF